MSDYHNFLPHIICEYARIKVKVFPQHAWTGPRDSGSVKAPDFLDVRDHEGDRSSALRTGRLYPKRNPWYSFSEAESTPGHGKKSPATLPGINPGTVRLVAQCLKHYATPGPKYARIGVINPINCVVLVGMLSSRMEETASRCKS